MTREEQDKLWNDLSDESKDRMISEYKTSMDNSFLKLSMNYLFGEHNLHPKLTYDDVARELFKDKEFFIYDSENDVIVPELRPLNKPINCTSRKQAEKLLAINKLLNVAKYLNRDEDGTDWVPDWNYVQNKWYLAVEKGKVKVDYHDDGHNSHIVYFRTEEIAQQAVQILGENVVMTALGNY